MRSSRPPKTNKFYPTNSQKVKTICVCLESLRGRASRAGKSAGKRFAKSKKNERERIQFSITVDMGPCK